MSEETQVAADAEGTLTAEAYSSLSQPTDNRQGRSRKKELQIRQLGKKSLGIVDVGKDCLLL